MTPALDFPPLPAARLGAPRPKRQRTAAQIVAARANGRKSRGPVSQDGRDRHRGRFVVLFDGHDLGALIDVSAPLPRAEHPARRTEEDGNDGHEQPSPSEPEPEHTTTLPGLEWWS